MEDDRVTESGSISRPDRYDIILISALVISAFIFRMLFISRESFWIDEVMTSLRSGWGIHEMLSSIAERDHLPLYYLIMHVWAGIFGSGEAGLRSFSALSGALSIIPLYLMGRRFSRRTAALAALITCFLPVLIYFGQEAKMYSLLVLLSSSSIYLLFEFLDPIHLRWKASMPLLIAVNILLAFTHYYYYLLLIGELILISYVIIKRDRSFRILNIIKMTIPAWVPISSFSIWLAYMIYEGVLFDQTTGGGISFSTISLLALIPFLSGSYRVPGTILYIPMISASLFLFLSSLLTFYPGSISSKNRIGPKVPAVCLLLLVPVSSLLISFTIMNIFGYRYFLILIPVILILAVWPMKNIKIERAKHLFLLFAVISSVIALPVQYGETDKYDWRGAVSFIEDHYQEGDIVVPVPHWERRSVSYYGSDLDVRYWTDQDEMAGPLHEVQRAWLIIRQGKDDGWTLDSMISEFGQPEMEKEFMDLELFLFSREIPHS